MATGAKARRGLWAKAAELLLPAASLVLWSCAPKESTSSEEAEEPASTVESGLQPKIDRSGGATSALDSDETDVEEARAALTFSAIAGDNADPDHVESDLRLPTKDPNGTTIVWTSGAPKAVSAEGAVERPVFGAGDVPLTLVATLTKGMAEATKSFALVVKQIEPDDGQAVAAATAALTEAAIRGANPSLDAVVTALLLPTLGDWNVAIAWESTNPALGSDGVVTRPRYDSEHAVGTLTARLSRGTANATWSVGVRVLKILPELLITEAFSGGFTDSGWVEILNTTSQPIALASYGWRSCNNVYACTSVMSGMLPAVVIAPGAYLLLHTLNGMPGQELNSAIDAYVPSLVLLEKNDFFEIVKGAQTIDFVRWDDDVYTMTRQPLSGTFANAVSMVGADAGTSIGRKRPYDDTDTAADWTFFQRSTPSGPNGSGAVDGEDADRDGLSDDYEVSVSGTDPARADTDGDWFTDGQEVLEDGVAGIDLRALGADPLVRDVFVEIDVMAAPAGLGNSLTDSTASAYGLALRRGALDKVRQAFVDYAPDGGDASQYPIRVHFDAGDLFDQADGLDAADYDLGGGGEVPFARCLYMGTDNLRNAGNCANLYDLKQSYMDPARRNVFHYFVVGWSQIPNGAADSSGLAEMPGNDGIITVGSWGGDASVETWVMHDQASTLLHELGHNLGLGHGGGDDVNYKPNYVSSMNYLYQRWGLDQDNNGDVWYYAAGGHPLGAALQSHPNGADTTAFKIGYSRGGRTTLNEASLAEPPGWFGVAIDFSADGDKNDAWVQTNVQPADYNTANTDVLADFDDWDHLVLDYQSYYYSYWNGTTRAAVSGGAGPGKARDDDRQPLSASCRGAGPRVRLP